MLRVVRWLFAVLGGVIVGAGLVLHGQVAMARFMRNEVESTFFLWRAIGDATFAFQGEETRMALAMAEVPEAALNESSRAGWVLVVVGSVIALTAPLLAGSRATSVAAKPGARAKR
jgi:hypothetical protein